MRKIITVILVLLALQACSPKQYLMRNEFAPETSRTYQNVTEAQFYDAAEKLLRLSGGSDALKGAADLTINRTSHSLYSQRRVTVHLGSQIAIGIVTSLLFGVVPGGQNALLNANVYTETTEAGLIANLALSTDHDDAFGHNVSTAAGYDLFWSRMDYLLGKSKEWRTCDDEMARIDDRKTSGYTDVLCYNAVDDFPEELRDTPRAISYYQRKNAGKIER